MQLTTRGRYAVTAILDLTLHRQEGAVSLDDISRRQGIAVTYLRQLFVELRRKGLVVSRRGPGGGYQLAKAPETIMLVDVIDAVGEKLDTTRCGGKADCQSERQCLTHDLWVRLGDQIRGFLSGISLIEAVSDHELLRVAGRQDLENVKTMPVETLSLGGSK